MLRPCLPSAPFLRIASEPVINPRDTCLGMVQALGDRQPIDAQGRYPGRESSSQIVEPPRFEFGIFFGKDAIDLGFEFREAARWPIARTPRSKNMLLANDWRHGVQNPQGEGGEGN